MPESPPDKSLWRHRDFALYWTGQTVDQFGSQVSWLAVPLIAIAVLHATKFEVAALAAAASLPALLVSLPAGVVVDRTRRRPMMIVSALIAAVAMGSIPLANAVGHVTLVQLYAVAFVVGALAILFDSAAQSLPPLLVGGDRLVDANGKLNTARGLAELAGPSAGGFLVGLLGAARAVTIDAFSYVFVAAMLALMRFREPQPEPRHSEARFRTEIAEGFHLVLKHPLLRVIVLANGLVTFLLAGVNALWLLYVITELHWSVRAAGLVYGVSLIGGIAGGFLAKPVIDKLGVNRVVIFGALLSAPLETTTPLAPHGLGGQWLVGIAFTLLTCAGMMAQTATMSVRQLVCPPEMLGRMSATNRFLSQGLRFLGPLAAGALATWFGLRPTLFALAGLTLSYALVYALSPFRTMREIPVHDAYTTPAAATV
jgi:MFS family permease